MKKAAKIIGIGFGALVALVIIIAITTGSGKNSSSPPAADVSASPDPLVATSASPTPSATQPFQPQTLVNVSGSGEYTTAKFTVGGSGDYDVDWTYNEGTFGQSVNFDFGADGGSDFNLSGPNQLGTGGSGVTHVYNDAGTHYLQISSEGNWTVKVITAP